MNNVKLTKTQQALVDAMKNGTLVYRSSWFPKYYSRSDTGEKCTTVARALLEKRIVEFIRRTPEDPRFTEGQLKLKGGAA